MTEVTEFAEFYTRHESRVAGIMSLKLPVDAVDDAAQDVWAQMYRHWDTPTDPVKYLNKVISSVVATYYRYRKPVVALSAVDEDYPILDPFNIEAEVIDRDEAANLLDAVAAVLQERPRFRPAWEAHCRGESLSGTHRAHLLRLRRYIRQRLNTPQQTKVKEVIG